MAAPFLSASIASRFYRSLFFNHLSRHKYIEHVVHKNIEQLNTLRKYIECFVHKKIESLSTQKKISVEKDLARAFRLESFSVLFCFDCDLIHMPHMLGLLNQARQMSAVLNQNKQKQNILSILIYNCNFLSWCM